MTHEALLDAASAYFPGATIARERTFEDFKAALYALSKEQPGTPQERLAELYRATARMACSPPPIGTWAARMFENDLPDLETQLKAKGLL